MTSTRCVATTAGALSATAAATFIRVALVVVELLPRLGPGLAIFMRTDDFVVVYPFGENIFWGSGQSWTAANAVTSWVDEKRNYHFNTNTCDAGKVCGHYTQVVWRKSTRIGCARVVCAGNRGVFITCNYNPPGNFNGERPFAFLTLDAEAK
ncbi:pathogenesis-related protein PRB1-2-like [Triticum aestivum]|uniref:pathogenesis-related protein PRB1-2-like n=1 Tax=Triticum aestivum TaxID=4565 RepID=UPI001D02080B|nr:pathogenesis-related protein PRB1-2-like [Triticum aestivum]